MKLNEISDNPGSHYKFKRLGRGIGSGKGKTSGRGGKGQTARSGVAINGFEGGQTPLHRRMPKRGFNNIHRLTFQVINIGRLQAAVEAGKLKAGDVVSGPVLVSLGMLSKLDDGVRLLGKGTISTALTLEVVGASPAAVAAIEAVGGKVVITGQSKSNEGPVA